MSAVSTQKKALLLIGALALPLSGGLYAQDPNSDIIVNGELQPDLTQLVKGPEIKGTIIGRNNEGIKVLTTDGSQHIIAINEATKIKSSGGFLGTSRATLAANSLLNGLPVTVKTMQSGDFLLASQIDLKKSDLKTANMIFNGTDGRFNEQTAATEALKGRMGDIDQYNVKATTNVNFAVGKATLTEQAKADLCTAATQASGMENSLLLVVGYTDSTGSDELNQTLSEKRASTVINHLQQKCGWKPYRVLTPTGMAEADPIADNTTPEGKAQNRRVAVNVLVSKAVDGL